VKDYRRDEIPFGAREIVASLGGGIGRNIAAIARDGAAPEGIMGSTVSFTSTNGSNVDYETGWISAAETWTYATATSLTVPGDVTGKYAKGDKIKLIQTTEKYFYVIAVAFSVDTTITVTGGSDYTVANAPITGPAYSKAQTPSGFPTWFNWTPVYTGFSADPAGHSRFKIDGTAILAYHRETTPGTSNATGFTVSLPVQATTLTGASWENLITTVDNGAFDADAGKAFVGSAGTVANVVRATGAGFTASGSKRITSFTLVYEF
jgi:hypothetical protein